MDKPNLDMDLMFKDYKPKLIMIRVRKSLLSILQKQQVQSFGLVF